MQQQQQQQHQQQQQQHQHQLQKQHSHEGSTHSGGVGGGSSSATMHCHTNAAYSETFISHCHQPQSQSQQQQHQQPSSRKHSHSHSPHQSRHTSPHSHHSHSQHSSPHQSQHHVHHDYESASPLRAHTRPGGGVGGQSTPGPHSQHQQHSHQIQNQRQRRRRQHNHGHSHHGQSGHGSRSGSVRGSGSLPGAHTQRSSHSEHSSVGGRHGATCARRHRSVADVSGTSVCHDSTCADREVQEILVRKSCCSSSRTELAQYFAEDLYGTSRRPSSCCTSSDYCYQTDSTSLYGSRSSLSRNNSIKSASAAMRKQQRSHQRQPSYTSISLRALNSSRPNSQLGSLTSIFDRAKQIADEGKRTPPSDKIGGTLERQTSKDALSNDLPEYACSPSPIRWSFLADGKSPTEFEAGADGGGGGGGEEDKPDAWKVSDSRDKAKSSCTKKRAAQVTSDSSWKSTYDDDERPSTSAAAAASRKRRDSAFHCEFEESTTVLFHQEGEAFNNCCNNYVQCNTYLDQDLQITSEDIHQYLSKGNQQAGDVLNNSKNYPFQPSNALEFQYKNNFANNNNNNTNTTNTASSDAGEYFQNYERGFRRNSSKETNLNQNTVGSGVGGASGSVGAGMDPCVASSCSSGTPLSPTNINLSSSTNNINIVFNSCMERNANEVKFINTSSSRDNRENVVSTEAHHSGYLPYTYPTYDYTNMSSNMTSAFEKPLGIDQIPQEFSGAGACPTGCGGASTTSEHSSSLQSPVQTGVSFESFDAASEHNLLSQRSSYQYSPTTRTPRSPGSPASASINPAGDAYVQLHYDYEGQQLHQQHSPTITSTNNSTSHHHHLHSSSSRHQHHHQQQQQQQQQQQHYHQSHRYHTHEYESSADHNHADTENFRLGNAFKRVRKRAHSPYFGRKFIVVSKHEVTSSRRAQSLDKDW